MEKRECEAMGLFAGLKAIANPRFGENIPRLGGIKLDFLAEMANEHAQVFSLVGVVPPQTLASSLRCMRTFPGLRIKKTSSSNSFGDK